MAKLPGSADVPSVTSRRDPGLNVPSGAFSSPLADSADVFSAGIDRLLVARQKQEGRESVVDRAALEQLYNLEGTKEFERIKVEGDLSSQATLQDLGKYLSSKRIEVLNSHKGNEESLTRLSSRLIDIESDIIGKAAALSTRLGREKVTTLWNDRLDPLAQSASLDPTHENVSKLLMNVDGYLDEFKDAFDPTEEGSLRAGAKEHIALSALDSLINSGRIEVASSLLEDGGLYTELAPETQRDVRRRIQKARFAKDSFDSEINALEARLGRRLTEQELLTKVGISPAAQKQTEKEKRIERLIGRGYSQELADDIASGNVEIRGPDSQGNYIRINTASGEVLPIEDKDQQVISEEVGNNQANASPENSSGKPKGPSLEESVTKATGPIAAIQTGLSNFIGPFVEGALFEETTTAKQTVRSFNQFIKQGFVNNPRFPVAEQQLVAKFLPDPDTFFEDPDRSRSDYINLKNTLEELVDAKKGARSRKSITTKRKDELSDQISRIEEILALMTTEDADKLPDGVPENSTLVGKSKDGNPVYKTSDGKLLEVLP